MRDLPTNVKPWPGFVSRRMRGGKQRYRALPRGCKEVRHWQVVRIQDVSEKPPEETVEKKAKGDVRKPLWC